MSDVQPSRMPAGGDPAADLAAGTGADAAPDTGRPPPEADATDPVDIQRAVVDSREFLARYRAAHPSPADPDRVQAAMMRRGGLPGVEHYARVFRAEGMPPAQAAREARRMVEADRELLARYPAR